MKSYYFKGKRYYVASKKNEYAKVVKVLTNSLYTVTEEYAKNSAYDLLHYIHEVLRTQRYKWKPLQADYKEAKLRNGLDGRMLVSTGTYEKSIRVWDFGGGYKVGVPNILHKPSGLMLPHLAKIHEFGVLIQKADGGFFKIPARPLWRPALSWWVRRENKVNEKIMLTNLNKHIKKGLEKI